MITPPYLQKGDKIAITCPAKSLPHPIDDAVSLLESWGLEVVLGKTVGASFHQYAGTDDLRTHDFQRFLDDPEIKAIIAARGGYGSIRIIDRLDFSSYIKQPKWIAGFSDITVLHSHVHANFEIATIHGQMPLNVPDATGTSLVTLKKALFGENIGYSVSTSPLNKPGYGEGILIGGNLTLLTMLSGSVSEMNFDGKILFIEDVGEYLYSIDRMLWNLKRSGKLARLAGLIVGAFTDSKDNDIPFGKTPQQIIHEHVKDYEYPVCFDFPAGHISDNHALILGKIVNLTVNLTETSLKYS
ncbi:LD-carboxypeptidase [Pedobacter sp. HMF7647]|uniref:LD-carboxypeptidase n=1 Tax=Hufsiella arboris TaxID=2695275 RepID=A0A7K1Y545_9SPHI|nr:LD-carboxypeptidase [Hufsiella arboris]MXV49707.1 LD-carboxypeptidase [Hufsiella arboris]